MVLNRKLYSISSCVLFFLGMAASAGCTQTAPTPAGTPAQAAPTVVLSGTRIPAKGYVDVKGSGFTPMADLVSHLKKPDGTEFPFLPMLSDKKGEITHQIDTLLLMQGTHELWIVDTKTGVSSNVAKFEVTPDQPPPAK